MYNDCSCALFGLIRLLPYTHLVCKAKLEHYFYYRPLDLSPQQQQKNDEKLYVN